MNYLYLYAASIILVLFSTAVLAAHGETPEEIDTFWDWLFYGILWFIIALKHLIKWIIKIFTT